jgi:hypothetical protein
MEDDGNIVMALGVVTLNASYLEEQIELLLDLLSLYRKDKGGWQISSKIKHAKAVLTDLDNNRFSGLIIDLDTCLKIFEDRNALVHGRIYAGLNRPDTLKSSRPNVPDRVVESSELYQLANEMKEFRSAVARSMSFEIPKALNAIQDAKA